MASLFISDLHLSAERPVMSALFAAFLRDRVRPGDSLYILGDLFEAWLGDDAASPDQLAIMKLMRAAAARGTGMFFMHGNRDFLAGAAFETMSGCRILPDPSVTDLGGEPVLLMHGDTLCTDDHDYQAWRRQVRQPAFMNRFLAMPVEERRQVAEHYRAESERITQNKPMAIMDANQAAIEAAMREHHVRCMIHGHTHRQAIHDFELDGAPARRIVLGDWYRTGSALTFDQDGFRLENFE
jgi:UDP-2,3-diacylglucosamine hydrolase